MQTLTPMTVDRRALHRIPELGDELPKTMDYVQDVLGTLGCEVLFPLDSAVCAYFDFGAADTLAFRAEMDALPIAERTGLPFASQHSGKMHACGHDGHMAMVLELGRRIRTKQALPHNLLRCFSPLRKRPAAPDGFAKQGSWSVCASKPYLPCTSGRVFLPG